MKLIATIVFFAFMLNACNSEGANDERFCAYFDLPRFSMITPDSARSALLNKFPLRTPAKEISSVVKKNGIGQDKLSKYYPLDERKEIICRVNRGSQNLVNEEYIIVFKFDNNEELQDIEVKQSLTGM